jgi:hypothetical protein
MIELPSPRVRGFREVVTVVEKVAEGLRVVKTYYVGVVPLVLSVKGATVIPMVPGAPRLVSFREGFRGVCRGP